MSHFPVNVTFFSVTLLKMSPNNPETVTQTSCKRHILSCKCHRSIKNIFTIQMLIRIKPFKTYLNINNIVVSYNLRLTISLSSS